MLFRKYKCMRLLSRKIKSSCSIVTSENCISDISCIENYYKPKDALQPTIENVSEVAPYFSKSFNVAAYANQSKTVQSLVDLGVDFSKIEKKPYIIEKILKIDFEDIKKHLLFIKDYTDSNEVGKIITKNPLIICETIENLEVRINYLQSKKFNLSQVQRIISKNPFWLLFSTKRIDRRLGFYQNTFDLCGDDIRFLATKQPNIITYNLHHIKTNTFVLKEEMGLNESEMKKMILEKPKIWMLNQRTLLERFNYMHNVMDISHEIILLNPGVLLCRNFKIKQRHTFLQKLGRAQYNQKKENYVPLIALAENTDLEFCKKYAKCDISHFNLFLKTC